MFFLDIANQIQGSINWTTPPKPRSVLKNADQLILSVVPENWNQRTLYRYRYLYVDTDISMSTHRYKLVETHLYPCDTQSRLDILSHPEWHFFRHPQSLALLKTHVVVNVNDLASGQVNQYVVEVTVTQADDVANHGHDGGGAGVSLRHLPPFAWTCAGAPQFSVGMSQKLMDKRNRNFFKSSTNVTETTTMMMTTTTSTTPTKATTTCTTIQPTLPSQQVLWSLRDQFFHNPLHDDHWPLLATLHAVNTLGKIQ